MNSQREIPINKLLFLDKKTAHHEKYANSQINSENSNEENTNRDIRPRKNTNNSPSKFRKIDYETQKSSITNKNILNDNLTKMFLKDEYFLNNFEFTNGINVDRTY